MDEYFHQNLSKKKEINLTTVSSESEIKSPTVPYRFILERYDDQEVLMAKSMDSFFTRRNIHVKLRVHV